MQHFQQPNLQHFQQQNMQHFQQQNMHHVQQQIMQNYQLQQQRIQQQQQQQLKNPKQNEGQTAKSKTKNKQQNKKPGPGNQQIPNLIDLDIPPPPFAEGFQGNAAGFSMRHADSMSNLSDDLMSFGGDDDDRNDDLNDLVCVDDDEGGRVKVVIRGTESVGMTEFARIDFIAKRSFLLHEVWFNENMIQNSNEIRISIAVFEGEHRSDIHSRSIKGVSSKSHTL
jgi:type II secretory pathway pseudopilin PulG